MIYIYISHSKATIDKLNSQEYEMVVLSLLAEH